MSGAADQAEPPASPCINVCVIDEHRGCCAGCRRTLQEIAAWGTMSAAEKRAVLAAIERR